MSDSLAEQPLPRKALLGAAALVCFALLATLGSRLTDVGTTSLPAAEAARTRDLVFADQADGSVVISLASSSAAIQVLEPGSGGFVRGVLRGLGRDRKLRGIGPDQPFRLTQWSDGRLSLSDPATGVNIDLGPFGPDNIGAFASLLEAAPQNLPVGTELSLLR